MTNVDVESRFYDYYFYRHLNSNNPFENYTIHLDLTYFQPQSKSINTPVKDNLAVQGPA
jgi:hypothetical protein